MGNAAHHARAAGAVVTASGRSHWAVAAVRRLLASPLEAPSKHETETYRLHPAASMVNTLSSQRSYQYHVGAT